MTPATNLSRRNALRATLLSAVVAIASGVATSSPAQAVPVASCPDGWTAVGATTICQRVVTASGEITLPDGVTEVDAVVVGGGGGGAGAFGQVTGKGSNSGGGGGGAVSICTALSLSGTVNVTIGQGGVGGQSSNSTAVTPHSGANGGNGTESSIGTCSAAGGFGGKAGGYDAPFGTEPYARGGNSGNGNLGGTGQWTKCTDPCQWYNSGGGPGAGAGGAGTSFGSGGKGGIGGPGVTPTTGLFSGNTDAYGGGGGGGGSDTDGATAGGSGGGGKGASSFAAGVSTAGAGVANTGGGGGGGRGGSAFRSHGGDGADGVVVLRIDTAVPVGGIETGRFGELQAFAVQRNPAYPACTDESTYAPFTVSRNAGVLGNPYSEATNGPVALGDNHLKVVASGVPAKPWGLALFTPDDDELRWNGSSWVTAPGGGFTTEKRFTETGQIYGVSGEGFLHDSGVNLYGTFISPNDELVSNRTYTPDAALNDCITNRAIGANLQNAPVSTTPVTTTTTTSTTTSTTSTSTTVPAGVGGIESGRFGGLQVFDVQRSPAWPECSVDGTYFPFTVDRTEEGADPYSEASFDQVVLGTGYLMVVPSGDPDQPWGLSLFNADDEELRWDGSDWITAPDGGFTTEQRFTSTGQIYGVSEDGLLHVSGFGGYGTFISPNDELVDSRTYDPVPALNECIDDVAIGANLQTLRVSTSPVGSSPTTTTTTTTTSTTTTSSSTTTTTTTTVPAVTSGAQRIDVAIVPQRRLPAFNDLSGRPFVNSVFNLVASTGDYTLVIESRTPRTCRVIGETVLFIRTGLCAVRVTSDGEQMHEFMARVRFTSPTDASGDAASGGGAPDDETAAVEALTTRQVFFGGNSADVRDDARAKIRRIIRQVRDARAVTITGHAADTGNPNQTVANELSLRRARVIAALLRARGIDVTVRTAYGKTRPVSSDLARNRRVEIAWYTERP